MQDRYTCDVGDFALFKEYLGGIEHAISNQCVQELGNVTIQIGEDHD
jgi:hypothetical protein